MPVRIDIRPDRIEARVRGAWNMGLRALSTQVLQDCNQYVKVDQHALESSSYAASQLSEGRLVWDTAYAKRQYWEIKTSLTPGRTWKWCERAKLKHKKDWNKLAEKGLRENL